jgi:hypothetical protein
MCGATATLALEAKQRTLAMLSAQQCTDTCWCGGHLHERIGSNMLTFRSLIILSPKITSITHFRNFGWRNCIHWVSIRRSHPSEYQIRDNAKSKKQWSKASTSNRNKIITTKKYSSRTAVWHELHHQCHCQVAKYVIITFAISLADTGTNNA